MRKIYHYNKLDEIRECAKIMRYYNNEIERLTKLIEKYPYNDRYKANIKQTVKKFNEQFEKHSSYIGYWWQAVVELNTTECKVMDLYYFEGLRAREIGDILGYVPRTIDWIKRNALNHLREKGYKVDYDK